MENCLYYDAIHDFSVSVRTNSNTADIDRFRSHTGKYKTFSRVIYKKNIKLFSLKYICWIKLTFHGEICDDILMN